MALMYQERGYLPPWIGYLAENDGQIVGTCAFRSAPVKNRVDIAYFTFPGHENKGIATEMASQLVSIAKRNIPHIIIVGQTPPINSASTRILRKIGFQYVRSINHPDEGYVWEWELPLSR